MTTKYLTGDALHVLNAMEKHSVDCVITSPPYFNQRDYGTAEWSGGLPDCDHKRPNRTGKTSQRKGGDGYTRQTAVLDGIEPWSGGKCGKCGAIQTGREIGREETLDEYVQNLVDIFGQCWRVMKPEASLFLNLGDKYAKKNLIGIPWRVAFALQSDGWILRNDIIWHKKNAMPQSVTDRFTSSHEHILLFAKQRKYYFDQTAIKEPAAYAGKSRGGSTNRYEQNAAGMDNKQYDDRNRRDVWSVSTRVFKGAHFATFSVELILPAVLAGCPEGGTILDPFSGAGTTGLAAAQNERNAVLIDINAEYHELARKRIDQCQPK